LQDIRNQRIYRQQRKQELVKLTATLEELHKKRAFYSDQVNYYDQYVSSCMAQMSKGKSKYVLRKFAYSEHVFLFGYICLFNDVFLSALVVILVYLFSEFILSLFLISFPISLLFLLSSIGSAPSTSSEAARL
jgi:hypothetical protein